MVSTGARAAGRASIAHRHRVRILMGDRPAVCFRGRRSALEGHGDIEVALSPAVHSNDDDDAAAAAECARAAAPGNTRAPVRPPHFPRQRYRRALLAGSWARQVRRERDSGARRPCERGPAAGGV